MNRDLGISANWADYMRSIALVQRSNLFALIIEQRCFSATPACAGKRTFHQRNIRDSGLSEIFDVCAGYQNDNELSVSAAKSV